MSGPVSHATHLSAQDIVDLRLSGLPSTKAGVRVRASTEGWPFELRKVRGVNSIYHNNGIQTWQLHKNGEVENVEIS